VLAPTAAAKERANIWFASTKPSSPRQKAPHGQSSTAAGAQERPLLIPEPEQGIKRHASRARRTHRIRKEARFPVPL